MQVVSLLLLLLLFTAVEFSLGGSSPYTSNKWVGNAARLIAEGFIL
jgi:hypothetical protein